MRGYPGADSGGGAPGTRPPTPPPHQKKKKRERERERGEERGLKFIENLFVSLHPAHVNYFDFRVQLCIATFSSVHIHFFGDIGIP